MVVPGKASVTRRWPDVVSSFAAEKTRATHCAGIAKVVGGNRTLALQLQLRAFNLQLRLLAIHLQLGQPTEAIVLEMSEVLFRASQQRAYTCGLLEMELNGNAESGARCPSTPVSSIFDSQRSLFDDLMILFQSAATDPLRAVTIRAQLRALDWPDIENVEPRGPC